MDNKKIVVALGRNCFGNTFPEQLERVKKAANAIADLVEEKYEVVITHSNGPQVGMIQTAMTEFARLDPKNTVAPMSVCSAMSQGYIGYDLQNAIRSELLNRGIYKPVSTIITQVRVDPFDKAFHKPSKVIGRYMTKEEADIEEHKGNYVTYEDGKDGSGYRRIIASPLPVDIYEIDSIKALVDAKQIVIAAGGGGIPVLQQAQALKGASAIIEKDYTASKLADMLDADCLMILTSNDYVDYTDANGEKKELSNITVEEANKLIDNNLLDPLTTLPKIEACTRFVETKPNRMAVITNVLKAKSGIRGHIGTIISNKTE